MAFKAIIEEGGRYQEIWIRKIRSKGTKPYSEPLPYNMRESNVLAPVRYSTRTHGPVGTSSKAILSQEHDRCEKFPFLSSNAKNGVHNKALEKVADQLEYVSNLFEAWYERREAYTLLGKALRAVLTFTKRWKDPKYWAQMRKTFKCNIKDPSSLPQAWLLWNFAIKPLVGTIDDAMKLLCQDMPAWWVEGTSAKSGEVKVYDMTYISPSKPDPDRMIGRDFKGKYLYVVKHAVRVRSLNPNAQLLNIMGATTPFSTFLNVVPWFWAVNYFVNINAMVSNLEIRFPGVNIDKSYTTVFAKCDYKGVYNILTTSNTVKLPSGYWAENPLDLFRPEVRHVSVIRTVSTKPPAYKWNLKYPALGSSQFANLASAIALAMKGASKGK